MRRTQPSTYVRYVVQVLCVFLKALLSAVGNDPTRQYRQVLTWAMLRCPDGVGLVGRGRLCSKLVWKRLMDEWNEGTAYCQLKGLSLFPTSWCWDEVDLCDCLLR